MRFLAALLLVCVCLAPQLANAATRRARIQSMVASELAATEQLRQQLLAGMERSAADPNPPSATVTTAKGANGEETKTIDTGDEGGSTTVVLSNQNSVGVLEDETRLRMAAGEQHSKAVAEQNRKDMIAHQIRSRTEAGRKLNAKIDEEKAKMERDEMNEQLDDVRKKIADLAAQRAGAATGSEQSGKNSQGADEAGQKSKANDALKQLRSEAASTQKAQLEQEEEDAKHLLQPGVVVPAKGSVLAGADAIKGGDGFTYAFWIKPDGKLAGDSTKWTNIFQKGRNEGERYPAAFLWPASTKLHIRSGSVSDSTTGCDPDTKLIPDKWTHLAISHAKGLLEVFFNGEPVCQNKNTDGPAANKGNVWAGSPWFDPAPVTLADFRYYNKVLSADELGDIVAAKRFKRPAF